MLWDELPARCQVDSLFFNAWGHEVALFAGAGHRALVAGQADCTEIEVHCDSTAVPTGNRWRHAAGESCKQVASLAIRGTGRRSRP